MHCPRKCLATSITQTHPCRRVWIKLPTTTFLARREHTLSSLSSPPSPPCPLLPVLHQLVEVYEDGADTYLVLELCPGGEVFDRIIEQVGGAREGTGGEGLVGGCGSTGQESCDLAKHPCATRYLVGSGM